MGKLFGSKGGLRVELDRGSYQPGDVVNGTVYFSVSTEIKTKGALVLEVNGEEYVKYNEVYGESAVPHKQSNKLLADQIDLSDNRESFAPGEYVFPFNYQLRSTLPASFHVDRRHAGEFCDIDAAVKYELKLRLPVKGAFKSDIKAERPLIVKSAQTAQLVQSRTDVTAKHAKLLGVIRQGNCEVSGSLERDVYVSGETLQVRASVVNGSSMDVKSVSVRLVENLVIHANGKRKEIKAQTCLAKKDFAGVKAGATTIDQAYSLDLVGRSERFAILPPMASSLMSTSHHVEVRCKFLMSPNVHIEIPVKILAPLVADVAAPSSHLMADHKAKSLE
ncbi:Arrestin domain-containing protein A [Phytophthora citrophthora]|uniref:Arrestin domain-containing protein A n=1 Tax=Phytophthora citrophthora TaxID=4793 RepID=A0AAD9G128_9STRA|nr:Arrestin domain-containing protein A [Phytophthora citrophthora]